MRVSLNMHGPELGLRRPVAGRHVVVLHSVAGVHSLDFVTRAGAEDAGVLRSLPPEWTRGEGNADDVKAMA